MINDINADLDGKELEKKLFFLPPKLVQLLRIDYKNVNYYHEKKNNTITEDFVIQFPRSICRA